MFTGNVPHSKFELWGRYKNFNEKTEENKTKTPVKLKYTEQKKTKRNTRQAITKWPENCATEDNSVFFFFVYTTLTTSDGVQATRGPAITKQCCAK